MHCLEALIDIGGLGNWWGGTSVLRLWVWRRHRCLGGTNGRWGSCWRIWPVGFVGHALRSNKPLKRALHFVQMKTLSIVYLITTLVKRFAGRESPSEVSDELSEIWVLVTTNCWLKLDDGWWTISPNVVRWYVNSSPRPGLISPTLKIRLEIFPGENTRLCCYKVY